VDNRSRKRSVYTGPLPAERRLLPSFRTTWNGPISRMCADGSGSTASAPGCRRGPAAWFSSAAVRRGASAFRR